MQVLKIHKRTSEIKLTKQLAFRITTRLHLLIHHFLFQVQVILEKCSKENIHINNFFKKKVKLSRYASEASSSEIISLSSLEKNILSQPVVMASLLCVLSKRTLEKSLPYFFLKNKKIKTHCHIL